MKANHANYIALESWLEKKDYEYHVFGEHQYRILGPVAMVDVWPARMTVHVITTESTDPNQYFKLNYHFKPSQLNAVLNGKDWKEK